jgi:26S proteasome non-ATPase regulatory subunit 9
MTDLKAVKEELFALQTKKRLIEETIEECIERLRSCGCYNDAPLVDEEGFPRSDIDVMSVAQDRKQLKELENDHKGIMKEMEERLHRLHALDRRHVDYETRERHPQGVRGETVSPIENVQTVDAVTSEPDSRRAFALIDEVFENSPAGLAGLRAGDKIVRVKHVTYETPNALKVFAGLVEKAENEELDLVVIRGGGPAMRVVLTPCRWSGRGLLGCHLVPII